MSAVEAKKMDRGCDALKNHVAGVDSMIIRQTRKGWLQECCGCEAKTEFKFFKNGETNEFATALEDSSFCCRLCLSPVHSFRMSITEVGTAAELLSMDRPCACGVASCKCCCYQEMTMTSGEQPIGSIKEKCWFCVPQFVVMDENGKDVYKIHSPTCCAGLCINCCAEGNPCGKGCCKASFRVYPSSQESTDGDAPYVGVILKKPKSFMTELLTDANAFEVKFPADAGSGEKALLMGSAIFFNANFFERQGG